MISIIIPVYNSVLTLEKCIDSVMNQTYKSFEILLIDDGSSDGSDLLCEKLQHKYNDFVRTYHKTNGGAASARNFGLKKAKGECIYFLDADDYIDENHLEVLYDLKKEYGADIACSTIEYVPGPRMSHEECVCTRTEFIELVLYRDGISDNPVGKLYSKDLFSDIFFCENIINEDFEIFYRLYSKCNIIAITNRTKYFYVQKKGSVSNSSFNEGYLLRIDICNKLINSIEKDCPNILKAAISRTVDEATWLYGIIPSKYTAEKEWINNVINKYAKCVLFDRKATLKVKYKVILYNYFRFALRLREKLKRLLIS